VFHKIECFAVYQGFEGLINNSMKQMNARSVNNIINKGGTLIKSARSLEFRTKQGREKAFQNILKNKIDALVVIGGDGSFTGGMIFEREFKIPVIGIPGTIDNDINGTSFTLGYDTAINTVIEVIDKIRDTASSHNRLFFVEVMGRDAGHIALNSGIGAGAEEILIPEENLGLKRLLDSLKRSEKTGKSSSIVVIAEGEKSGKNVFEIASYVEQNLPYYEVRVSVLGHMQRGGAPSCFDRVLGSRMGVFAVESLQNGSSNVMVGIKDEKMTLTPLNKAIKGKSVINKELIRVSDILSI
jgi:6-phosphofructokinase 1